MESLALKLLVTPLLVGVATLSARRWGQSVGGWLIGFPLTSGPVVLFLALDRGSAFAATAAVGALTGAAAQATFCLAFGLLAGRRVLAFAVGSLAFAAAAAGLLFLPVAGRTSLPLAGVLAGVVVVLAGVIRTLPRKRADPARARALPPRWDVPARMAAATSVVLVLTAAAPFLGARLSGLLATYPILTAVLAVFAHRLQGPVAATEVLRGLLFGLFAFSGFFFCLAVLVGRTGIGPAFAVAAGVALVVQAGSLVAVRREASGTLLAS